MNVYLLKSSDDTFYPVTEIIFELLDYWNRKEKKVLFNRSNIDDWHIAARALAREIGADSYIITDNYHDVLIEGERAKAEWERCNQPR